MLTCPECGAELPSDATLCPCCGKTFLTAAARGQKAHLKRVIRAALSPGDRSRRLDGEPLTSPFEWRVAGGLAAAMLLFFYVASAVMKANFGEDARNPWIGADGYGRLARGKTEAGPGDGVRVVDTQLVPGSDSVEGHGELTNGSRRALLEAELITFFTTSRGRSLGTATGVVRNVRPGGTVGFKTRGSIRLAADQLRSLQWRTELGAAVWEPGKDL